MIHNKKKFFAVSSSAILLFYIVSYYLLAFPCTASEESAIATLRTINTITGKTTNVQPQQRQPVLYVAYYNDIFGLFNEDPALLKIIPPREPKKGIIPIDHNPIFRVIYAPMYWVDSNIIRPSKWWR